MIIKCSRRRGVAITTTLPMLWCYKFHFMQICLLWQFFRCFKWFAVIFSLWLFGKYCSTYCSWANWSQLPQENIMWKIYLRKTDTNSHRRCSIKKVFLKISQYSQKNISVAVFLIKLQAYFEEHLQIEASELKTNEHNWKKLRPE